MSDGEIKAESGNTKANKMSLDKPYEFIFCCKGNIDWVKWIKVKIQFIIGFVLIVMLSLKGCFEVIDTFIDLPISWHFYNHMLNINTFAYIGKALAISAGLDLGYMLFTKGPDEALEPLLLAITSAAFFTLSDHPDNNWVIVLYAISILIVLYCMRKYKDWKLDKDD